MDLLSEWCLIVVVCDWCLTVLMCEWCLIVVVCVVRSLCLIVVL